MGFVKTPNLPETKVEYVVVDGRIDKDIERGLCHNGIKPIKTKKHEKLYQAVAYHPDMFMHHIGENRIVYAPNTNTEFLEELKSIGFELIEGCTCLEEKYPFNIAYNVCRIGKYAIHNFKYTDEILKRELQMQDVKLIDVKQGYAKCSISVVDENTIITSDKGIIKVLDGTEIETLYIEPDENILLESLNMGFIGGSTGLIDEKKWAVSGNLRSLRSYHKIINFLQSKNIEIICLSQGSIRDIGTIIPLKYK